MISHRQQDAAFTGSLVFNSRPTGFAARPGPGGQAAAQRPGAEARTLYPGRLSHRISSAGEHRPAGTARYLVRGGNHGTLPDCGKNRKTPPCRGGTRFFWPRPPRRTMWRGNRRARGAKRIAGRGFAPDGGTRAIGPGLGIAAGSGTLCFHSFAARFGHGGSGKTDDFEQRGDGRCGGNGFRDCVPRSSGPTT